MNLVIIAAVLAVGSADKLDRTYLPPASAKTAGGSAGSLQLPLNSFNNGLGGIPKGSYTNEHQGVVVDAAAAGTRASGQEESGLGAPRISYGSADSKVGAAAFRGSGNAFGSNFEADGQVASTQLSQGFANSNPERANAAADRAANTLRFDSEVGPESYNFAFETDNGIFAEESGVATNGVQAQGGYSYTGDDGQVYSVTYTADENGYQPKGDHLPTPPPIPDEILKSLEQNAREEAAGISDDGSYDAQKYNTGDDNSQSGVSNGEYNHQSSKFGSGETDATASGTFISQNNQRYEKPGQFNSNSFTGHNKGSGSFSGSQPVSNQFAHDEESESANDLNGQSSSHGQFGSGNTQPGSQSAFAQAQFGSGSGDGQSGSNANRFSQSNKFGSSSANGQFGQTNGLFGQRGQSGSNFGSSGSNGANKFSQSSSTSAQSPSSFGNRFGNRNEYLPPTSQNNQGQESNDFSNEGSSQSNEGSQIGSQSNFAATNSNAQGQSSGPSSGISANRPGSINGFGQSSFNAASSQNQNRFGSSDGGNKGSQSSNLNYQSQSSQSQSSNGLGSRNEYLPPVSNQNRPQGTRPTSASQFSQQYNAKAPGSFQDSQRRPGISASASAVSGPQSSFGSQSQSAQLDFQSSGSQQNQKGNRFAANQGINQNRFGASGNGAQGSQTSAFASSSLSSQKATAQPDTELTTPFEEPGPNQNGADASASPTVSSFSSSRPHSPNRPGQFGSSSNNVEDSNSFSSFGQNTPRPQRPRGNGQSQSSFAQSSQGQFNQQPQFSSQSGSQDFDALSSSSTSRPSFAQPQGADDSYYYNQPSKSFGTPQESRFPNAPSNQPNQVNQQTSFSQSQFSSQGSSSFPQNGPSTRYPRPPTIAPPTPSQSLVNAFQSQSQYNGITQASISPFPSETPTQATQQNKFGSRPNFQTPNRFGQQPGSAQASFGQQGSRQQASSQASFGQDGSFGQKASAQATFGPQDSFQTGLSQQASSQATFGQKGPAQTGFGQQASTQATFGQQDSVQADLGQQASSQATFGPQGSAQTGFGQDASSQASIGQPASSQATFGQNASSQDTFGQQASSQATFGPQASSQSTFGQSSSSSFPQRPSNGKRPSSSSFQSQSQISQQPKPSSDKSEDDSKPSQQYNGEIYEYTKPAETLPAPEKTGSGSGQFGQKTSTSQGDDSQSSTSSQVSQTNKQGSSRPQFGQTQQFQQNSFNQQSSFSQSEPEAKPTQPSRPQFGTNGGRPFSSCCQGSKYQNRFGDASQGQGQIGAEVNQGFEAQSQSQFGPSNQFSSSQGFKPAESTSNFSGNQEVFEEGRKPPSFDENTGYQY